ncbi:MAG: methyltransferase [Gordonia sp. (in: high G+C Gram-positive bacteria)]|uniref:methyltransferase family protein n=1 Tax=Gordonia sp. (in: high G+C Gram-positive bacteria) TaxID=84139 RepID=UPI0039E65EA7
MPDVEAWRPLVVLVPVLVAGGLWVAVPDTRRRSAATLALLWNLVGLTAVNALALHAGWWSFGGDVPAVCGVPVDLLLAWAVLWSLIPVLAERWVPVGYTVTGLLLCDVYGMTRLRPMVDLAGDWWWGELVAAMTCLLPGIVLAVLTVRRRHLWIRVVLQVVLFTGVLFGAIPVIAFTAAAHGPSWTAGHDVHVSGVLDVIAIQVGGVVALIALAAVIEFARAGGTPWPWDPPAQVVTTGPYAYVANPMQLCGVVLIALTAAVLSSPMLLVAALVAAAFSAGLAAWVEDTALSERCGESWTAYRSTVHDWLPRLRPSPAIAPARVYLARGCDPCSDLAAWITDRSPVALQICAAEDHREPLRRIRYEQDSPSYRLDGIRAVGAVMTHLNLAWAVVGWVISAPVIARVLQLLVDASGGGPRDPRTATASN